jgi:beta-glucosidase
MSGLETSEPGPGETEASTFRDPRLPLRDRVENLLARLTLAEKTALLHQHQPAIPRLGIAAFRTGTEALHGLAWLGPATVFPQAIGLASSWNLELVRAVGAAVGDETRGFHHKDPARGGLNVWAPVVNQLRDPRWGRNEEGYAEDPLLTSVMATAYAGGLRGEHPSLLKTAPTLKHFLGYNNETRRETTSSNLGPRVLYEYELPAFRGPIESGAAVAVMASYNLVNGRPAHLSPLINDELRSWCEDELLVVSDAQAPTNVATTQGYYPDHVASHAALVRAGVDSFTDNDDRSEVTVERLTRALELGRLTEADIDAAARRVLWVRFRLGEFDDPATNPFAAITEDVINCPAHQRLALRAARQSFVLLKNAGGALPLPATLAEPANAALPATLAEPANAALPATLAEPANAALPSDKTIRVAVLGPLADAVYEDWYSGTLPYAVTARRGLAERLGEAQVEYVEGADRIALRVAPAGPYVVATAEPDGARLRVEDGPDRPEVNSAFDLVDWGHGVKALRAAANGRHVTVDTDGALVNDQLRPNGWVVRETFRLEAGADGEVVMRHIASGRYVVVGRDRMLSATGDGPEAATPFTVQLISSGRSDAVRAAREADVAVVVVGNHPLINGRETEDRVDLALPPAQEALLQAVHAANPRTVAVVQSSYPYGIEWVQNHVPAVIWSAHGGQEYGHALADVLFGDAAPAGRLTQTWYASAADLPDLLDYDIIADDATYLYFRGTPLYPFGHGLTYTTFAYSDLRCRPAGGERWQETAEVTADGELDVSVVVTNTGARASDEVVQLYTRQHASRVKQPLRQLRGFQRIHLAPDERMTVHFRLRAADLAFWDVTRNRKVVEESRHSVMVGRSSIDIHQATTVTVRGELIPARDALAVAIPAAGHDDYAGIDLRDASPTGGDTVSAAEPGAWIAFAQVDFGAGAGACTARVSAADDRTAVVTLRLDDPLQGSVIGTVRAPCPGGRYGWVDAVTPIEGASGVHDLYAVFGSAGVGLDSLSFSPR